MNGSWVSPHARAAGACASAVVIAVLLAGCTADRAGADADAVTADATASGSLSGSGDEPGGGGAQAAVPGAAGEGTAAPVDDGVPELATADPDAPPETGTEGLVPPGFVEPGVVLMEDAFDGAALTVTAIEVQRSEAHDRIVFEMEGSGFPGWQVQYGDPGEVEGWDAGSVIQVDLAGVESGSASAQGGDDVVQVLGVAPQDGGEGAGYVIGLQGAEKPFRAFLLTEPNRLVIDVADGS